MALERDFPPDLRVENEIKSLLAGGHSVVMACFTLSGADSVLNWNGCKVYKKKISTFEYKSSVGALRFPFYFRFWKKYLNSVIDFENPDVIHIHDLPLAKLGYEFQKKYNIKFTLDLHENWPAFLRISHHTNTFMGKLLSSNKQWEKYELECCANADRVIVVIEEAKERLVGIGVPQDKIFTVANYPVLSDFEGIDLIPLNKEKQILFYAGGIGEHRGLQYVVKALPLLIKRYPAMELWILGEGNYRETLENLSSELDVSEHVKFFGQVSYKTVLDKLNQSTLALIPHEKSDHTDSTIPHKLFQYMYAGKPVISSNCTPIERIVNITKSGKTYQWNSPEDFEKKTIESLESIDNFNFNEVRDQINKSYNWENESKVLLKLYSNI